MTRSRGEFSAGRADYSADAHRAARYDEGNAAIGEVARPVGSREGGFCPRPRMLIRELADFLEAQAGGVAQRRTGKDAHE